MFTRKVAVDSYTEQSAMNMLGYILQNRETIISYESLDPFFQSISGMVGYSKNTLIHELDYLVAYFAYRAYAELGIKKSLLDKSIIMLFDDMIENEIFDEKTGKKIRDELINRISQYSENKNIMDSVKAFIIQVYPKWDIYSDGIGRKNEREFKKLYSNIAKYAKKELAAQAR